MHLVKVDMVSFEPEETFITSSPDMISRESGFIGPIAHFAEDFGGNNYFFPPVPSLSKPFTDNLFSDPFPFFPAIHIGSIKEINTEVEGFIHNFKFVLFSGMGLKNT